MTTTPRRDTDEQPPPYRAPDPAPDPVPAAGLGAWLVTQGLLPDGLGAADVRVEQLAGGSSNLTYRVRAGGTEGGSATGGSASGGSADAVDWVLRRPPAKGALPTAHDVIREFRIQKALEPTNVPVPRMVAACADLDVIGAPFYLMSRLDGMIHNSAAGVAGLTPEVARAAAFALVETLAGLHAVEPMNTGLRELARPESYLDRTLRRWRRQWELSKAVPVPVLDGLFDLLDAARPPASPERLVHGDYNLANVMYSPADQGRVLAVLDWELATLGDPLADLGALLAYWGEPGRLMWARRGGHLPDANPGFPGPAELVARYAATAGTPPGELAHLAYHEVLATVKLAVICAGSARRVDTPDPARAAHIWELIRNLAGSARERAEAAGLGSTVPT